MELSARDETTGASDSTMGAAIVDSVGGTNTELQTLRKLLLGADYQQLLALKQQMENPSQYSLALSQVVSEAIAIRAKTDGSIGQALGPTIEGAIDHSIKSNPKALADSLYPVMGPAIRKSIFETINAMLEGFNQAVEQSLSPKSIGWRLDAWRSGKTYSEIVFLKTLVYRVEQVFLIHRESGLVLHHLESTDVISKDPEMVSAMLTAIQDFIGDSFETSGEDQLSTLQLGDLRILIEQGPSAVVAAAVRGNVTPDYRLRLSESLERCHEYYSEEFETYDGDNAVFVKLPELLQPCLSSLKHDDIPSTKKVPWIAWLALMAVTILSVIWWYQDVQRENHWQSWIDKLDRQAGIVITGAERDNGKAIIKGLKDPFAQVPAQDSELPTIDYQWSTFYSTDEAMQFKRLEQLLTPPSTVLLNLSEGTLSLSGSANFDWYQELRSAPLSLLGIFELQTRALQIKENNSVLLDRYLSDLASVSVAFDIGEADIDQQQTPKLYYLSTRIRQLQAALIPERQVFKIRITGSTDSRGTDAENRKLGLSRAKRVSDYLAVQGVSLENLKTDFHLSKEGGSDDQSRRIIIEAWVENLTLDRINQQLSTPTGSNPSENPL
ncbi:MAG: OmpA family protein [Cellvibrionaceae bacterium]